MTSNNHLLSDEINSHRPRFKWRWSDFAAEDNLILLCERGLVGSILVMGVAFFWGLFLR